MTYDSVRLDRYSDYVKYRSGLIGLGLFLLILVLNSCGEEEDRSPQASTTLASYIDINVDRRLVRDSLIACALGADQGFISDPRDPISILYYPEGDVSEVGYFESASIDVNPDDLTNYTYKSLEDRPLFNGYLRMLIRERTDQNVWCRVTFVRDGNIHISNAIRIKYNDFPTESNNEVLSIDQSANLSPIFTWTDGLIDRNAIYFHVVLDDEGELVSGTYTFEKTFQFYNLSNVVLNIRDVNPPPTLEPSSDYTFVLMAVSLDNWVNLLIEQPFSTE